MTTRRRAGYDGGGIGPEERVALHRLTVEAFIAV
jgi:hypothetical protein